MDTGEERDTLGFEIKGISEVSSKADKIKALEAHYLLIEGLTNECLSDIEKRIHKLKR